jgi:putative ABC transport system permease protein
MKMSNSEINSLSGMQGTDYVLAYSSVYAEASLPKSKLDVKAAELLPQYGMTEKDSNAILPNSNLLCYRDNELDTLIRELKTQTFDKEAFRKGEGVILINGGALNDSKARKSVLANITTLKPGDNLDIVIKDFEKENATPLQKKVNVLSVVEKGMPGFALNQSGGVYLIVSEKLFRELAPDAAFPTQLMVMMQPNTDHTAMKAYMDSFIEANPDYNLTDLDESAKNYRQVWTVMSIFLYGFVAVISLIGCLNIINTISTNIIIRTRELSVMRAVGMSDGNVRRMIALESVLHGAAAALIGSVAGTLLSRLLYNSMSEVRGFPWQMPWLQILIAVGAAALVAVISGFVPLKRISRSVIIEGIRGEE